MSFLGLGGGGKIRIKAEKRLFFRTEVMQQNAGGTMGVPERHAEIADLRDNGVFVISAPFSPEILVFLAYQLRTSCREGLAPELIPAFPKFANCIPELIFFQLQRVASRLKGGEVGQGLVGN